MERTDHPNGEGTVLLSQVSPERHAACTKSVEKGVWGFEVPRQLRLTQPSASVSIGLTPARSSWTSCAPPTGDERGDPEQDGRDESQPAGGEVAAAL